MIRLLLVVALAVAGCGHDAPEATPGSSDSATGTSVRSQPIERVDSDEGRPDLDPLTRLEARIDEVDHAVQRWATADDLDQAREAAGQAAALIAELDGPEVGGDGVDVGLLPVLDGDPAGLAVAAAEAGAPSCITDDILGGSWSDPAQRWQELDDVLSRWRPDRNTMPELASHAQRVLGWSRLTTETDRVDIARTYGGHAALHVTVMRQALSDCGTG